MFRTAPPNAGESACRPGQAGPGSSQQGRLRGWAGSVRRFPSSPVGVGWGAGGTGVAAWRLQLYGAANGVAGSASPTPPGTLPSSTQE